MTENQELANRIASLLETGRSSGDIASIFASLEKINHRLDKLENATGKAEDDPVKISTHPSSERFSIAEAIADEVFGKLKNEKACAFEPNGKPCDHCSMCSSRGF